MRLLFEGGDTRLGGHVFVEMRGGLSWTGMLPGWRRVVGDAAESLHHRRDSLSPHEFHVDHNCSEPEMWPNHSPGSDLREKRVFLSMQGPSSQFFQSVSEAIRS